jgi:hypothetical protein
MKKFFALFVLACLTLGTLPAGAQSDKKSSGVVEIKMSRKKEPENKGRTVGSATFTPVKPQSQPTQNASEPVSAGSEKINWMRPGVNTVNTSRSPFNIKATITTSQKLRVANLFLNDQFYKSIIISPSAGNQVLIDEKIDLTLGNNVIRLEGVTTSGKRIEDKVFINYDLSNARYYALIIAVQEYDDPAITDLDQPISDADKFYRIISSRYTFNQEDITYLKNPTKADIIGTLHKMRGMIKEDDNLLIYYAGHGYWDEEMSTGYWLPRDAERDNPVNWLPNTDLTNYLSVLKTKHTLLVADACFSGGIFKTRSAFSTTGTIEKLYRMPSRKAITSGTLSEVPDQSVFVEYLLKRLNDNPEYYLSSEQLFSSMRVAVMNNSPNVPQYGTIQNVGDEGGDFIFIRRK